MTASPMTGSPMTGSPMTGTARNPKLTYPSVLQTNNYLRGLSDTTYWLCIPRTVQESKLFPINPYILLSYLKSFSRWPTLLREIDAAAPAEELAHRAREVSLK